MLKVLLGFAKKGQLKLDNFLLKIRIKFFLLAKNTTIKVADARIVLLFHMSFMYYNKFKKINKHMCTYIDKQTNN